MSAELPHVKFTNPSTLPVPPGFTQVVEVIGGRTVYISGQVALDSSGNIVGQGNFPEQAQQVFRNLQAALAAAGAGFSHVVKLNMYLLDMGQLRALLEIRDRYVNTQQPPASTAVEVRKLAYEAFLLEIEAVATLPQ